MKRALVVLVPAAIAFAAGFAIAQVVRTEKRPATATRSMPEVVNAERPAGPTPAPLPTLVEGTLDPRRISLSAAVPADANIESASYVLRPPRQLIVTWDREHLTRDRSAAIWQRRGVAIWQLESGTTARWRRVFTRETSIDTGVEGYDVALGDATGDGRAEVLVFVDTDGSAGSGSYHLFSDVGERLREVFTKELAKDDGTVSFGDRALVVREGVGFHGAGIHCCFRQVRETLLRWNGTRMVVLSRVMRKNRRGWPPG